MYQDFTFPRDDISSVVTLPGGGIEVCIGKFNLCRDVFQYHICSARNIDSDIFECISDNDEILAK